MSRNHFYASHVDEKGATVNDKTIKIGGATGFWGETDMAMSQFFAEGHVDFGQGSCLRSDPGLCH